MNISEKLAKIMKGRDLKKTVTVGGQEFDLHIPSVLEEGKIAAVQAQIMRDFGFPGEAAAQAPQDIQIATLALATFTVTIDAGLYAAVRDLPFEQVFRETILPLWGEYVQLRSEVATSPTDAKN